MKKHKIPNEVRTQAILALIFGMIVAPFALGFMLCVEFVRTIWWSLMLPLEVYRSILNEYEEIMEKISEK